MELRITVHGQWVLNVDYALSKPTTFELRVDDGGLVHLADPTLFNDAEDDPEVIFQMTDEVTDD